MKSILTLSAIMSFMAANAVTLDTEWQDIPDTTTVRTVLALGPYDATNVANYAIGKYDETNLSARINAKYAKPNGGIPMTDLASALQQTIYGKQDALVSGVNIKTINNQPLVGPGNIHIQGGGGGADSNVVNALIVKYDETNLTSRIDAKATSNALAAVAWSGAYGDLSGRPTIPEVPSGVVVTNENGAVEGLKLKAVGDNVGLWLDSDHLNIGYFNGNAMVQLPLRLGYSTIFSGSIIANGGITANSGISASSLISATEFATGRDDWSGYTYDGSSSHNLQAALDAKVNASSLAAVATSGSYGDLSNKPTIPTDEGITNAATAVFADCADYILTNAATSAAFTIRSGEIAQTAISGTSLDLTLDFSTAANRSGDCLVYAVCAQDATLAILPSASVAPLGTDWTALKAGTNIVCVMRLAYDGAKSVLAVAVKEVK